MPAPTRAARDAARPGHVTRLTPLSRLTASRVTVPGDDQARVGRTGHADGPRSERRRFRTSPWYCRHGSLPSPDARLGVDPEWSTLPVIKGWAGVRPTSAVGGHRQDRASGPAGCPAPLSLGASDRSPRAAPDDHRNTQSISAPTTRTRPVITHRPRQPTTAFAPRPSERRPGRHRPAPGPRPTPQDQSKK